MKARSIYIILMLILWSVTLLIPQSYGSENTKEEAFSSLRLMGTLLESDSTKSLAVIKNSTSKKPGVYSIGDKILDYQIVKIIRCKVVLLKDGKISILEFPLGNETDPIIDVSSNERIINRSALSKKILDLNMAMKKAVPIPHIESGKIVGFKIAKIKDKALAKKAGIKEGDIVTKVNSQSLDSLLRPFEVYHNLRNQEKIAIELKRGNEIKNLIYYVY